MENTKILPNSLIKSITLNRISNSFTYNINKGLNRVFKKYQNFRYRWLNLIKRRQYFIRNNLTDEEKYNIRKIKRWFK